MYAAFGAVVFQVFQIAWPWNANAPYLFGVDDDLKGPAFHFPMPIGRVAFLAQGGQRNQGLIGGTAPDQAGGAMRLEGFGNQGVEQGQNGGERRLQMRPG